MRHKNPLLRTDSYKNVHWSMEPPKTTKSYKYMESRGGMFDRTMFFGMNWYLKEYLLTPYTEENIKEAKWFNEMHFRAKGKFNEDGYKYIFDKYGGFLPVKIKSVPEGTVVPYKNVLLTVESTDEKAAFATGPVETSIMRLWCPITVGTNSLLARKDIRNSIIRTGGDLNWLNYKLHDFGPRGVSSGETAEIAGAAHLAAGWEGSDNEEAIKMILDYYNFDVTNGMFPAYSIPASEHSIALLWGDKREREYVLHMLRTHWDSPVSVIGDTWNIFRFLQMCADDAEIRQAIIDRPFPTVFRLDSGDPVEVILKSLQLLWNGFGGSYNDKHFKCLHPNVKILQGDGISRISIRDQIIPALEANKWCFDVFGTLGSGGKLLQAFGRDDNEFAMKDSYAIVDGVEQSMFKDPITGSGKRSKPGMLKLTPNGKDSFQTISSTKETPQMFNSYADALQPVYENGKLLVDEKFSNVRARSEKELQY